MNALYKALFYFKARDLTKDILIFLLPENKYNEKSTMNLSKKLETISKIYKKVNWNDEPKLQKILLLMYLAKKNYLNQNYSDAKKLAFEIKKNIISSESTLTEVGKNLLIFNAELIELKCLTDEWSFKANEQYDIFYKGFFKLTESVLVAREAILKTENKQTQEYIELNQAYLLALVTLNEMSDKKLKGLIVSEEVKSEGKALVSKLNYFEDKIKKFKNDTFTFTYNILLEKIKLSSYGLVEKNENFKLMFDFCNICVNNSIEDPVYSALESFRKNKIKNNSFKDYLYSFKLEIFKSSDKKILFKLKKIENYIAKENERIQIKKVKSLEEINATK